MTISSISTIAANAIATYRNVDTLLSEEETFCSPELVAKVPSVCWILLSDELVDEKPLLTVELRLLTAAALLATAVERELRLVSIVCWLANSCDNCAWIAAPSFVVPVTLTGIYVPVCTMPM